MPKIELHGYGKKADEMRRNIVDALVDYPGVDGTVTEIYDTTVISIKGEPSPYLQIVASPKSIGGLIELLEPLNEDIEVIPLGQWIPKKT
jgi:hypothetical protein